MPNDLQEGEEKPCRVLPKCADTPGGIPDETCHKAASLAQIKKHSKKHHKARQDDAVQ